MAEYIERENLLKVLPPKCNMGDMYATAYNTCLNTAENLIKEQPTADVVPVVRCKDCKYFEIDEEDELGECKCGYIAVSYNGALYPHRTDYCSYGERRCEE